MLLDSRSRGISRPRHALALCSLATLGLLAGADSPLAAQARPKSYYIGVSQTSADSAVVVGGDGEQLLTVNGGRSWHYGERATNQSLWAVNMQTSRVGLMVGDDGAYRTVDGGVSWEYDRHFPAVGQLLALAVHPSGRAIAVGTEGGIVYSARAGVAGSWTPARPPVHSSLGGVAFADSAVAFAVGDSGVVLRSGDGGTTWSSVAVPTRVELTAIAFFDARTGIVTGRRGTVLRTSDAGRSWNVVPVRARGWLRGVAISSGAAFIVGDSGAILRSTDAGLTWTPVPSPTRRQLSAISLRGSGGTAVGSDETVLTTSDGGLTWQSRWKGTGRRVVAVNKVPGGWLAAVESGTLMRSPDGVDWTLDARQAPLVTETMRIVGAGAGAGTMLVAGDSGVHRSMDGGRTWRHVLRTEWDGQDVALAGTVGLAVIQGGEVYRSADGGLSWSKLTRIGEGMVAVAMRGATALAVGGHTVARSTDAGRTWSLVPVPVPATINLNSVVWSDSLTALIAGDHGILLRTRDGGVTWTPVPSGTAAALHAVVVDRDLAVAVGDSGTVVVDVLSDKPMRVRVPTVSYSMVLWQVGVDAATGRIVAGGDNGYIFTSADRGRTWQVW